MLVEEDEDGSSTSDLSSDASERARRELWEAHVAEQERRDPNVGGYDIDPGRPCILSEMEPNYTRGARLEDLELVPALTDVALSRRDTVDAGGFDGVWAASLVNGCEYEGEWRGGLPHGRGSLRWPDGTSYSGDIRHGHMTGEGTYLYATGVEYHGQVVDGLRHGVGLMLVPRPRYARYQGEWNRGQRHGHGVLLLTCAWCVRALAPLDPKP